MCGNPANRDEPQSETGGVTAWLNVEKRCWVFVTIAQCTVLVEKKSSLWRKSKSKLIETLLFSSFRHHVRWAIHFSHVKQIKRMVFGEILAIPRGPINLSLRAFSSTTTWLGQHTVDRKRYERCFLRKKLLLQYFIFMNKDNESKKFFSN